MKKLNFRHNMAINETALHDNYGEFGTGLLIVIWKQKYRTSKTTISVAKNVFFAFNSKVAQGGKLEFEHNTNANEGSMRTTFGGV